MLEEIGQLVFLEVVCVVCLLGINHIYVNEPRLRSRYAAPQRWGLGALAICILGGFVFTLLHIIHLIFPRLFY